MEVIPVIQDRICRTCSRSFEGGPRAWYCPECRAERRRMADLKRKQQGPMRPLGSTDKCERCGKSYIVVSGLQRFCPDCKPINDAEVDRKQALTLYRAEKDAINPARNERRRIGLTVCVICGKEFDAQHTCRNTCSDECHKKQRQQWQKAADAKRSPRNKPSD